MLEVEERIRAALNEAGVTLSQEALKRFDTDGAPIRTGAIKWSTKGQVEKVYQTPYGEVHLMRHVYQASGGGKTYLSSLVKKTVIGYFWTNEACQATRGVAISFDASLTPV